MTGGSAVLVVGGDADQLDRIASSEHVAAPELISCALSTRRRPMSLSKGALSRLRNRNVESHTSPVKDRWQHEGMLSDHVMWVRDGCQYAARSSSLQPHHCAEKSRREH